MTQKTLKTLIIAYLFGALASLYFFLNQDPRISAYYDLDFNKHEFGFILGRCIILLIPIYLLKISIGRMAKIYWSVTFCALLSHLIIDLFPNNLEKISKPLYSLITLSILCFLSITMMLTQKKQKFLLFGKYEQKQNESITTA